MNLEQAILTALEHERRVRDHYRASAEVTDEPVAGEFFALMTREEQGHVDYLESRLHIWQEEGRLEVGTLATAVPSGTWLDRSTVGSKPESSPGSPDTHIERLHRALRLEQEVSEFYRQLVATVAVPEARRLFQRFLEIEEGHTAVVQAEIDSVSHTGFFFDVQEFTLDG